MHTHHLSRRQLLGGLWASLVGACWPGKGGGDSPTAAPVPPAVAPERLAPRVMAFAYDGAGRCVSLQDPLPGAGPPTVWRYEYECFGCVAPSGPRVSGTVG
jgi:hypothetical protein